MTDTANPYPANDTSSFVFTWHNATNTHRVGYLISFYQRYDLENNKDAGIIEYWNGNYQQWFNIDSIFTNNQYRITWGYKIANNDTTTDWGYYNYWDTTTVLNSSDFRQSDLDTLPNGLVGFTGKDTAWQHVLIYYNGVVPMRLGHQNKSQYDLKLRFTLISDSVQSGNEGWEIDNFKLVEATDSISSGGIETYSNEKTIKIFPNPAKDKIKLDLSRIDGTEHATIQIFDELGRQAQSSVLHNSNQNIDITALEKGLYQIIVRKNNRIIASGRFVKE